MTAMETTKKTIKEAIIVEGRDDTAAIRRAVSAMTIETHGFGMPDSMWPLIEKAYNEQGIIISAKKLEEKWRSVFQAASRPFCLRERH